MLRKLRFLMTANKGQSTALETGGKKPLTMREDLGGEYSEG
jgi:hypothetical protein